ncbi:hypothetical protein D0C28_24720 [Rhizobium sp. AU243]|nr:hypothetical protein D0C28_24720 [Rhizobium sp. AU243]
MVRECQKRRSRRYQPLFQRLAAIDLVLTIFGFKICNKKNCTAFQAVSMKLIPAGILFSQDWMLG